MTTMTSWQPFGEFADLHERLDRLFERMTNGEGQPALPAVAQGLERRLASGGLAARPGYPPRP